MKTNMKKMRILVTIEVIEDETTDQPPQDDAQTALSRFVRLEDLPAAPPCKPTPHKPPQRPAPAPIPAADANPPLTVANGRQPHLNYSDGRKIHTCSRCGALGRRINHKTGRCGLRSLCVLDAVGGISTANFGGVE